MKQQIGDKVDRTNIVLEGIERAIQIQNRELQGVGRELFRQNTITEGVLRRLDGIERRLSSSAPQLGQQV